MTLPRSVLLVPALALAACTQGPPTSPPPAGSGPPAAAAPASAMPASASPAEGLAGAVAPDFTATAQDGTPVHLAALQGKPVVLYFYPKDETPGCTKEACSFRDSWDALAKTGAVLVGISADTLESHRQFAAHYKLPFLLVSDPLGSIAKLYGVPFFAVHQRQTIVIGADGRVRKVYRKVDVTTHAQEVLTDLGSHA